jgi:hypothetical protein
VKDEIYQTSILDIEDLKNPIRNACFSVTQEMLRRARRSFVARLWSTDLYNMDRGCCFKSEAKKSAILLVSVFSNFLFVQLLTEFSPAFHRSSLTFDVDTCG